MHFEAAAVRQVGARLQRSDRPRDRNFVDHGLHDPRGDLALVGRPRVEEHPGRDLDRRDAEPRGRTSDAGDRRGIDLDARDPGPQLRAREVREQRVVDRQQMGRADHEVRPGGRKAGVRSRLDTQKGVGVVRSERTVEYRTGGQSRVFVNRPGRVPGHGLHPGRAGIVVVVVDALRAVDVSDRRHEIPGGARIVEPVDRETRACFRDIQSHRRVPLVLGDRVLGLGHHQVGEPQEGQDHRHQGGDDQSRPLLTSSVMKPLRVHLLGPPDHRSAPTDTTRWSIR